MKTKLTSKDLTAISELMNFEQSMYKQCMQTADCYLDPKTKDLAQRVAECHKSRFNNLLSLLG